MSPRTLWAITLPLALLGWLAVVVFTGAVRPSLLAFVVLLPLTMLAVTMSAAGPVWLLARALHLQGTGERPALALRAAAWVGLWATLCLALRLADLPIVGPAVGLAVVLALMETYLLQADASAAKATKARERKVKGKPKNSK